MSEREDRSRGGDPAVPGKAAAGRRAGVAERTRSLNNLKGIVVGLLGLPREAASAFILGFLRRDYAAAGLFRYFEPFMRSGTMTWNMEVQVTVALVTVTLFVPCIANFFMILKERGWKTGVAIMAFITPFAFGVGAGMVVTVPRSW